MGKAARQPNEAEGLLHHHTRGFPNAFELDRERTLADFVGDARRPEVFAALRTPTPSVKTLVERFMAEHFTQEQMISEKLKSCWPQIVGGQFASLLRPVNVNGDCLTIEAVNATVSYAYCNPAMQRLFLDKIRAQGIGGVNRLRVTLPGGR